MVKPSTALAGLVACDAGLVVVNDAVAVLPRARLVGPPPALLTLTPAFWKASTMRALPASDTWVADSSVRAALNETVVALPSRMLTTPVVEFHDRCARSLTVKARRPSM